MSAHGCKADLPRIPRAHRADPKLGIHNHSTAQKRLATSLTSRASENRSFVKSHFRLQEQERFHSRAANTELGFGIAGSAAFPPVPQFRKVDMMEPEDGDLGQGRGEGEGRGQGYKASPRVPRARGRLDRPINRRLIDNNTRQECHQQRPRGSPRGAPADVQARPLLG
jgi:hypothetical protein